MPLGLYGLTCEYQQNAMGVGRKNAAFGWKLSSAQSGAKQSAYRICVCDERETLVWDSGKVPSCRQFGIEMPADTPLQPMAEYTFSVMVWDEADTPSEWASSRFVTGVFRVSQWQGQWFRVWWHGNVHFYRHEFEVEDASAIRYAYAYIASRGDKANSHIAYLNGAKLGDSVNFPGATEYFRALYHCVDVKDLLHSGKNAIGLVVTQTSSLVLKIVYRDGHEQYVTTARDTWREAMQGPYTIGYHDEMQRGKFEEYDARKEFTGWTQVGYDDSEWQVGKQNLTIDIGPLFLQPQYCRVKAQKTYAPVQIVRRENCIFVDFGTNMAGFVSWRLKGTPDTAIEIRYAEKRTADGDAAVLSDHYPCYNKYTFATDGVEEYTPSFMHTGFRCVEIYGYDGPLDEGSIVAVSIHSDVVDGSHFACSDSVMERLNETARKSFLSNMVNIPTDCPERERRGWTADAYAVCEAECVNFNALTFYRQWLESMRDCQRGNGWIPVELPLSSDDCIDINWPAAAVLIPYDLYIQYGDVSLIREFYPMMCGWVSLLEQLCDEEYRLCDAFMSYKDWICRDPAGSGFLAMAYFYRCADLLSRMAAVIEREADATRYAELAENIRRSIDRQYLHRDGERVWYDSGSQSADAHALYFGICPPEHRGALTVHLVENIQAQQTATTGFMGTMCLLQALSQNGRADVAYALLKNRRMGGWLYLIEQCDATTFPEHYDGGGSQNHAFLGSAPGLWIYKHLAGIQPTAPGYKEVRIAPYLPEDMTAASATVDTLYGPIHVSWERGEETAHLRVELPPNVSGTVDWNGHEYAVPSGVSEF